MSGEPKLILDDQPQENELPEEIVVVTGEPKPDEGKKPDAPLVSDDDDEGDDGDDTGGDLRIAHEQRDEDVHERRKRERQERKERQRLARQRKDEQIDQLVRQNAELARQVQQLAANQQTQLMQSVDQRLNFARQHLAAAEGKIADATNRGDGAALTEALRYRDQAQDAVQALQAEKRSAPAPQQPQAPQPPQLDAAVAQHAQAWAAANPWFNYNDDTPQVRAVKNAERVLLLEGYNPRDREFWTELSRRSSGQPQNNGAPAVSDSKPRGGPKVAGGATTTPRRTEYHLSEERVRAMKDAGIWDDPKKKERQIKAYMEYDRQNPSTAR